MQKRVGMLGFTALALVIYLIWQDPSGTAGLVSDFAMAFGDFFGELWSKLGEFISSLTG